MAFCGSRFWDSGTTWYASNPSFTPCFEGTVLSLFPLTFLATLGFIDLYNVKKSNSRSPSLSSCLTPLTASKAMTTLLLIILYIVHLLRLGTMQNLERSLPVDWLSSVLQVFGFGVALFLCVYIKYNGVCSSACQFFYWTSTFVTQGLLFWKAVEMINKSESGSREEIMYSTRLISFPLVSIRFLLELLSESATEDTNSNEKEYKSVSDRNHFHPLASPDKSSSFFSKLFFFWYDAMAWTGYKRTLTQNDLWELNPQDRSHSQSIQFQKYWDEAVTRSKGRRDGRSSSINVLFPLWKCYGQSLIFGWVLKVGSDLLIFAQPIIIRALVAHLATDKEPSWKGFFYMGVITFTSLCETILSSSSSKRSYLTAMRVKTVLSNAVFRKTLRISNASRKASSLGSIVNLQSVDALKLSDVIPSMNSSMGSPFQIIIATYLLYQTFGISVLSGISILLFLLPLTLVILTIAKRFQDKQMKLKDERVKITSEVISGIKILKLYGWEGSFQKRIDDIRNTELIRVRNIALLSSIVVCLNHTAPILVTLGTFSTYVLIDPSNILNSEKTFVALNLINIMKNAMTLLPMLYASAVQASVSLKRLNNYLNLEERHSTTLTHDASFEDPIVMKNASLSWTQQRVTLKNINFSVKEGQLVGIVGRVGSGKSSLISSLLGDLIKLKGIVNLKGTISYVPQTSWIQNATLRDNIIFHDAFHSAHYKEAIHSSALIPDLKKLPFGDETEIGENGMNLSGGQKQRVAIARAAYKDASIYLFDDPLSAVDSQVGNHIFENLIGLNGILRKRTRVFVTHGISFLSQMDMIYVMKDGEIAESGTYKELIRKQGEFSKLLLEHLATEEIVEGDTESVFNDLEEAFSNDLTRRNSVQSLRKKLRASFISRKPSSAKVKLNPPSGETKLIQQETVASGNIKLRIFGGYFKAAGIWISTTALLLSFLCSVCTTYSNVWLSNWSSDATNEQLSLGYARWKTTKWYLIGYACLGAFTGLLSFASVRVLAMVCLAATKSLQSQALEAVIRSPMSYFDTTLIGRLINRFSKDVDTLDNVIPVNLRSFVIEFFHVLSTFIVISYATPFFIILFVLISILYIFLQRFYVATSRQLKRLDGITRSPIYSHFSETISGSSIIRAFHLEKKFIEDSERKIDRNQMAYFPHALSNMWISIRLELMGVLVICFTCFFTLLSRGVISPGSAGLAIAYAFQVTLMLSLMTRMASHLESNIVSAERVEELTHLQQEAPWELSNRPLPLWPQHGELKFEYYKLKYRQASELALKGISCLILPGEKIGVVGRTGAGKSSLTMALFRLFESSEGKIYIDGLDISKIGLHDLRKKLTIIPQDALVFSGTIRFNLDPFTEFDDEEVWRCLELAHLKSFVLKLEGQLQYKLDERGKNLSVGQKQLICLARALLRKTKIFILDEATAALDLETDNLIKTTIQEEFEKSTVITIAHRLNTVLDSNRIIVLDHGEIKEFEEPRKLLMNKNSHFYALARDAKII